MHRRLRRDSGPGRLRHRPGDFGSGHSLNQDPTVLRLRAAAELLEDYLWIAVARPSPHERRDDVPDGAAITRWSTVVGHPDDLDPLALDPFNGVNRWWHASISLGPE